MGNCHRHIHIQWIVPEWRNEWLSLERKKKNRCRSARLPGITSQQHRFGGTEYNLGRREIGHVRDAVSELDVSRITAGGDAAEPRWRGWIAHVDHLDARRALGHDRRAVLYRYAVRLTGRPDGAEVWVQADAVPHVAGAGVPRGVLLSLSDVTKILMDTRLPRPRYGDEALAEVTTQLAAARLDPLAIITTVTSTLSRLRPGTWVASLLNKDPRTARVVAANDADPLIARYVEDMHLSPSSPTFTMATRVLESKPPLRKNPTGTSLTS